MVKVTTEVSAPGGTSSVTRPSAEVNLPPLGPIIGALAPVPPPSPTGASDPSSLASPPPPPSVVPSSLASEPGPGASVVPSLPPPSGLAGTSIVVPSVRASALIASVLSFELPHADRIKPIASQAHLAVSRSIGEPPFSNQRPRRAQIAHRHHNCRCVVQRVSSSAPNSTTRSAM